MGYYTSVTGGIDIVPPASWGKIKDTPYHEYNSEWTQVELVLEEHEKETDEGVLLTRQAVSINPGSEDSYKAYYIEEQLQDLVDKIGPGHEYVGRLEGDGEESGDQWRLYVVDGKVKRVVVQLVWPEE